MSVTTSISSVKDHLLARLRCLPIFNPDPSGKSWLAPETDEPAPEPAPDPTEPVHAVVAAYESIPTREALDVAIATLDELCGHTERFSPEWEQLSGAVTTLLMIRDQRGCTDGLGVSWPDDLPSTIDTIVFG